MLSDVNPGNPPLAAIFGLAGAVLTPEEKVFFRQADPLGFILFARNVESPAQIKTLTGSLHECMGREVPVLIDQEGGRVQRLKPPHWKQYPPAQEFGEGRQNLEQAMAALAAELANAGVNVNCAPVLDLRFPETHDDIGNRSFGRGPDMVAAMGAAVCRAFLSAGIVPVIKHLPGLGRADMNSHLDLPVIHAPLEELQRDDFAPFREIMGEPFSEAVWGMAGHAIYKAVDEVPASCSRDVISDIIRKNIGFDGLLLSDDLSMGALAQYGGPEARAEMVLKAGCDIALHCNGKLDEMQAVARRIGKMTNDAVVRYNRSAAVVKWNFGNDGQQHRAV